MAGVTTYSCTRCRPVDTEIIEAYLILTNTSKQVSAQEADRVTAEQGRVTAENERERVFGLDHGTATDDHATAVSDHGIAVADHGTAGDDHTLAAGDHVTAGEDHLASTSATSRANDAAAAAEHMVDIHQGPPGPSGKAPVVGANGNWWTWDDETEAYVDSGEQAQGPVGATPDISIGTVTTGEPGDPASASMGGTAAAPILNLTIPKGQKGDQGNTGSSVDYPYELVNNLTTNDATKGLSAAQGKVLKDELTQLEAKVTGFSWTEGKYLNSSGSEVADAAWGITGFIPYTQGNDVIWKWGDATQVSSGRCICFYRADKTYISNGYWSAAGSTGQKTISAAGIASDAGQAAYIRASFKLGEDASVTIGDAIAWEQAGGLAQDVRKNTQDIESLDGKVSLVNKVIGEYGYKTTADRYIRYDTGEDTASTFGVSATDFIDLGKSSSVIYSRIKVSDANSYWGIAFYNSNKEYISGQQAILNASGYGYENTEIQVPANAKFVRASILPVSSATGFYIAGNGGERIDKMEQEVSVLDESVISALSATQKPSPITVTWENGFYFDDTKAKLSNQNWSALTLDVEQYRLKTLSFVVNSQVGATAYGFLEDENGTTLWSVRLDGNPFSDSVFLPANAKTFKLSNRSASGDAVVSVLGYEYIDRALDVIGKIDTEYLDGKKISFLGDSITEGTGASSPASRFSSVLCDSLGAVENNLGVAGTCLANNTSNGMSSQRFVTRATQANLQDSDLVVVFGGTNDFSYDSKAIGDLFAEETITPDGRIGGKKKVAVTDTDTFAGALHELIGTIRQIIPTTPILFVTPLNRGRYTSGRPTSAECNVNGDYLVDFADAINEICRFYSIPVLDLNANSELDFSNSAIATAYSADSLHPNNNGHKVIAEKMEKFIFEQIVPKLVS